MFGNRSKARTTFIMVNYAFLIAATFLCLVPILQVLAISFSSSAAAQAGKVMLLPVDFTVKAYSFVSDKPEFWRSIFVTLQREIIAVPLSLLLSIMIAYPLSKETKEFRFRTVYVWVFVLTMLFEGGLIPNYVLMKNLGLLNTLGALVLPGTVPIFCVVLLLNFFRNIPKELTEAAFIDGANQWQTAWRIAVPISLPALATITLLIAVAHWNSWFDGIIYMNDSDNYPLSSYLQTVIVQRDLNSMSIMELIESEGISDRTVRAAQIFLGTLPIMLVYPFLQKYFIRGIVLGSVKG